MVTVTLIMFGYHKTMPNYRLNIDYGNLGFKAGLVMKIDLPVCGEHGGRAVHTIAAMHHSKYILLTWMVGGHPIEDESKYFTGCIGIAVSDGDRVPIVNATINLGSILGTFAPFFRPPKHSPIIPRALLTIIGMSPKQHTTTCVFGADSNATMRFMVHGVTRWVLGQITIVCFQKGGQPWMNWPLVHIVSLRGVTG